MGYTGKIGQFPFALKELYNMTSMLSSANREVEWRTTMQFVSVCFREVMKDYAHPWWNAIPTQCKFVAAFLMFC